MIKKIFFLAFKVVKTALFCCFYIFILLLSGVASSKDERKNFNFDNDHSSDANTFTFGSYTPNKNDFEASRSSRMP